MVDSAARRPRPRDVDLIASTSARDVATVSCDQPPWRAMLNALSKRHLLPVKIAPVDLFPQTFHCETVVHFRRN